MRNLLKWSAFTAIAFSLVFTSCNKEEHGQKEENQVKIKTFKEKKKDRNPNIRHKKITRSPLNSPVPRHTRTGYPGRPPGSGLRRRQGEYEQ